MQEDDQTPEEGYGAQLPPPLPPPLPRPSPHHPALRRASLPVRRPPRHNTQMEVADALALAVTLAVWAAVAIGAVMLWVAKPHSIEGVGAMLALLLYQPLMVVVIIAGMVTLLHSLARRGWAMFAGVPAWLLLAGVIVLWRLYRPVAAIRDLPVF